MSRTASRALVRRGERDVQRAEYRIGTRQMYTASSHLPLDSTLGAQEWVVVPLDTQRDEAMAKDGMEDPAAQECIMARCARSVARSFASEMSSHICAVSDPNSDD